jgi:hypothetical protein
VTIGISTPAELDGVLIPVVTRWARAVGAAAVHLDSAGDPRESASREEIRVNPRPVKRSAQIRVP